MKVTYLGREVDKHGFRAFVYNVNGTRLLINSWEEFDEITSMPDWYDSVESFPKEEPVAAKPKRTRSKK